MQKTKIELTSEELETFKWCWKNYEVCKFASRIKPGRVVLHLDKNGKAKPEYHVYNPNGLDKVFGSAIIK